MLPLGSRVGHFLLNAAVALVVCAELSGKGELGVRLPAIERILPLGGQAGTEVTVSLLGDMLSNAEGIDFDCTDLSFSRSGSNAGSLEGRIRISPTAAPGPHLFRVRTKDGPTNSLVFTVGQFRAISEHEPNDSGAKAQSVSGPCEIYASMGKEDRDFFTVTAEAGERWLFEVRAAFYGSTFESQLYLRDENGRELAFNDDRGEADVNSTIDYTFPKKGKYQVHVDVFRNVRSWEFTKNCGYVLRISKLPRPYFIAPLGSQPGKTVKLHIGGTYLDQTRRVFLSPTRRGEYSTQSMPWTMPVRFTEDSPDAARAPRVEARITRAAGDGVDVEFEAPSQPLGTWSLFVEGTGGTADPELFEISPDRELAEIEPNDGRDANQPISFAGDQALVINANLEQRKVSPFVQDIDYYAIDARKGAPLHIYTLAYQLLSPRIDTVIRVLSSDGKLLAESDDLTAGRGFLMGSADSSLYYVPEKDGPIFVAVLDRVGRGGPDYNYRLHVKVEEPGFQLIASPQFGLRSVPISNFTVARGGEANVLVSLFRLPPKSHSDDPTAAALAPPPGAVMKGAVRVWLQGLPEGATAAEQVFREDEITEPGGDGVTMAIPERLLTVKVPASVPPGRYPFQVRGEAVGNEKVCALGVAMDSIGGVMGSWNYLNLPGAETVLTVIDPGGITLEMEKEKVAIAQGGTAEIVIKNLPAGDVSPDSLRLVNVPAAIQYSSAATDAGMLSIKLQAAKELPVKPIEDVFVEVNRGNRIVSTRRFTISVFAKENESATGN